MPYHKRSIFGEQNNLFDAKLFKVNSRAYLRGYWQSEKYFSSFENEIRSILQFESPAPDVRKSIIDTISSTNSVSIHIRRTDYINDEGRYLYSEVTPGYYQRANELLKAKIPDLRLFIFSDDIEWVKQHVKFDLPTVFIDPLDGRAYEDLKLMSICKFHITTNSTFSWWGAWLAGFKNKIIIAPERWFNPYQPTLRDDEIFPRS